MVPAQPGVLISELRKLIDSSRGHVAQAINSELVWLYWQVGSRLRQDVVGEGRAAYGERVLTEVASTLSAEYGRGFNKRSLYRMMRFAEVFPDPQIVTALRSQLSWTHLREIIAIDDPLKRRFSWICRTTCAYLLNRTPLWSRYTRIRLLFVCDLANRWPKFRALPF